MNNIAFVVVSCDRYADLWHGFFQCFHKYWGDFSWDLYLVTNHLDFKDNRVKVIKIGDDIDYSTNLLNAIEQINADWILLWLEDSFLSKKINNQLVNEIVEKAINTPNLGYLKLSNDLPLSYNCDKYFYFGKIPKGVKYRSAIGLSLYRKDVLQEILVPGQTAWQIDKSGISDSLIEDFYALSTAFYKNPLFPYVNTVIKGKWYLPALSFLRKEGMSDIVRFRKKQQLLEFFYIRIFLLWSSFFRFFKIYWYR